MRTKFHQSAGSEFAPRCPDGSFAPHCFDDCVGREVPFKIDGVERGRATVIAVTVDEDGRGATWTVDITGGDETRIPVRPGMNVVIPEPPPRDTVPLDAKPPRVQWRTQPPS